MEVSTSPVWQGAPSAQTEQVCSQDVCPCPTMAPCRWGPSLMDGGVGKVMCAMEAVAPTAPRSPHPPNNKVLKTCGPNTCSLDTPFGTKFPQYLHPVPN